LERSGEMSGEMSYMAWKEIGRKKRILYGTMELVNTSEGPIIGVWVAEKRVRECLVRGIPMEPLDERTQPRMPSTSGTTPRKTTGNS
jgi:hypothetical protein